MPGAFARPATSNRPHLTRSVCASCHNCRGVEIQVSMASRAKQQEGHAKMSVRWQAPRLCAGVTADDKRRRHLCRPLKLLNHGRGICPTVNKNLRGAKTCRRPAKLFILYSPNNQLDSFSLSRLSRGAYVRVVTNVEVGMRWTRRANSRRLTHTRTAKPFVVLEPTLAYVSGQHPLMTGAKRARSRARAREAVL